MKIAFDVDGIMTDLVNFQIKYGKKFFNSPNITIDDTKLKFSEMYKCSETEEKKFWERYIWAYSLKEKSREGIKELIDNLKKHHAEIYIFTARAHTAEPGLVGALFRGMLKYWLKKEGIQYDHIHYCTEENSMVKKVEFCNKYGIDVMFEDQTKNIDPLSNVTKVITLREKHNSDCTTNNVTKLESIKEISSDIENIKISKNNETSMNKDKGKVGYQITRVLGSPLFKMAYRPLIIDKEFIPSDGPVILCGNHLHVWDQFPVICATKRTTHWMSKKEYFDSYLGPFFKMTGAICVDRNGDASASSKIAMDYLNVGSAVGLFPEGTRNHLKNTRIEQLYNKYIDFQSYDEFKTQIAALNPLSSQVDLLEKLYIDKIISKEDFIRCLLTGTYNSLASMRDAGIITSEAFDDSLLLPFKYGAVSMSAKTGAPIVPFAVNGDYTISNDNLIVRFGEPIYCSSDTLEEDNINLRNKILTLEKKNIEKNNKI